MHYVPERDSDGPGRVRTYFCAQVKGYTWWHSHQNYMDWGRCSSLKKDVWVRKGKKLMFTKISSTSSPTKPKNFVWKIIIFCVVEKLYRFTRMTGVKTSLVPYHLLRNYPNKQHHGLWANDWPILQNSIFKDIWFFPLPIFIFLLLVGNHQTQRFICSDTWIHN